MVLRNLNAGPSPDRNDEHRLQKAAKANLLDHFYDYLEEPDWLEGVDLYHSGKVQDLKTYEGLILAKVIAANRAEVRLKIHPAGHCIQWIECTCRKNRTLGQYCEHIAAFMIHVDRERPELFGGLDSATPLKPPAPPKKPRAADKALGDLGDGEKKRPLSGATQTIIDHLKGNIHGLSLIGRGPALRVRIEIKPGHLTHYDLGLDAAAGFLRAHPNLDTATQDVRALIVSDEKVEMGTRLTQPDPERIVAERVVMLPLPRNSHISVDPRLTTEQGSYLRIAVGQDSHVQDYLVVPMKTANKFMGTEGFFLPGVGYYKINQLVTSTAWGELPLSKTFKDDDAAELVHRGFAEFAVVGPLYLDSVLQQTTVVEAPKLGNIHIIGEEGGWFRLDLHYGAGKGSISMAALMKQYRGKRRKFIRSGDTWMKIPDFVTAHQWELSDDGESVKVDAMGLMRLKAAVGDFDAFVGSKKAVNEIRNRLEFVPESSSPVLQDTGIHLREYQDMGLRWLWWLFKNGLHGLLADEMGLGKTHQAMALMAAIFKEKPNARFLVICPTTVLDHWTDKIEQFANLLGGVKYHGTRRMSALGEVLGPHATKHTLVTSYGVMLRDIRQLCAQQWDALILDEAHFVKNNDTATYQAACKLPSRIRICLTGTPMENHLGELKNLFDFLVPGYLGSDEYFRQTFMTPLAQGESHETTLALQKLIHPFKMRRTKSQVLKDLPAKVEDLRHCALSDEQVKMYRDVVAMKAQPLIEQLQDEKSPVPYLHVFATLTMLKQICDHPALMTDAPDYKKHHSGKFDLLIELLDEAFGSDHKVVIFSQYVGMIKLITAYLTDKGIGHSVLTGQTRNRGAVIKAFQTDPNLKVFCGSLLAGGIGIDLTAASVVIHYDRWWNATKENQATDRVHRIGQNKNVQVLKLVTRGTLEEKIDRMIQNKRALFEKFLDQDEEVFKTLSRQELIDLLR